MSYNRIGCPAEEPSSVKVSYTRKILRRPLYIPDSIETGRIPVSLMKQLWSMGKNQILARDSAEALIEAEIFRLKIFESGLLEKMGLDPEANEHEELTAHCTRVAVMSLLGNDHLRSVNSEAAVQNLMVLARAGMFHDLGKWDSEINEVVTSRKKYPKGDPRYRNEWDIIKRHPGRGAEVVLAMPGFRSTEEQMAVADAVYKHHERLDGTGYLGKKGVEIGPVEGLIGIADSIDAMSENRGHDGPQESGWIVNELVRCSHQHPQQPLEALHKIHTVSGTFVIFPKPSSEEAQGA